MNSQSTRTLFNIFGGWRRKSPPSGESAEGTAAPEPANDERFRSLLENASEMIVLVDKDGAIRYQSPSVERVLGYSAEALAATPLTALIHPEDMPQARALAARVLRSAGVSPTTDIRVRHRNGSWRTLELICNNLLADPSVRGIVVNGKDISLPRAFEERLAYQALHDHLTSLPNRALFMDRLEHALARAQRNRTGIAVLMLDLDHFRVINDSLGYEAGDELLLAVGQRIRGCLRASDTAARLGADEFLILIEDLPESSGAVRLAERITGALTVHFVAAGHVVHTTASVGIVHGGHETPRAADLLRDARIALHRAKASGRGSYEVFNKSIDTSALERLKLEIDLRHALERQQFIVHYQPTVNLTTGKIEGLEALVRWERPGFGRVPPSEFIPVAEEIGLIRSLGHWVLAEACRQLRRFNEQFPELPTLVMSVNLSARQLHQPDLVADIATVLKETGLPPHLLQLEITESAIMEDAPTTISTLRQLKELGVMLAIDDFGTGYSSLSYLRRFPMDVLKIDKAFVGGLGKIPEDTAIVQAVITLANTLGMRVTAEGIESEAQLTQLQALGSHLGQGFYFARPAAQEEVTRLFAERSSLLRAPALPGDQAALTLD